MVVTIDDTVEYPSSPVQCMLMISINYTACVQAEHDLLSSANKKFRVMGKS
jgi:hypothetical protein